MTLAASLITFRTQEDNSVAAPGLATPAEVLRDEMAVAASGISAPMGRRVVSR